MLWNSAKINGVKEEHTKFLTNTKWLLMKLSWKIKDTWVSASTGKWTLHIDKIRIYTK